jgi:hypothetical protein
MEIIRRIKKGGKYGECMRGVSKGSVLELF